MNELDKLKKNDKSDVENSTELEDVFAYLEAKKICK
jgi:hypothetical protein